MLVFNCHGFILIANNVGALHKEFSGKDAKEQRSESDRKTDKAAFKTWLKPLEELNMPLTRRHVERMMDALSGPITFGVLARMMEELQNRLTDEFERGSFLYLSPSEAKLFDSDGPLFDANVDAKFPATTEDIAEAGKCLALGRSTAAVFHLMRVVELALQKFGDELGVTLTMEKNWQNILDEVNKAIKSLDHKQNRTKALAEVSSHLYGVKVAWRNEVMHPKQTYTPDEADAIFGHVRTFMRELATIV